MKIQTGIATLVVAGSAVILSGCTLTDGLRGLWGEENSTEQSSEMEEQPRQARPIMEEKPVETEWAQPEDNMMAPAATGESAFDAALDAADAEVKGSSVAPTLPSNL